MQALAAFPLFMAVVGYVGQFALPSQINTHPVVLLTLNANDIVLVAVAHKMQLAVFMLLGITRLFITDPFLYQLGYEFGPTTHAVLESEFGERHQLVRSVRWLERKLSGTVFGWLVLFAIPGYPMCLLAGISQMNRFWFITINLAGTSARLAMVWWLSDVFKGPIGTTVKFIGKYSIPLTVLITLVVVARAIWSRNQK